MPNPVVKKKSNSELNSFKAPLLFKQIIYFQAFVSGEWKVQFCQEWIFLDELFRVKCSSVHREYGLTGLTELHLWWKMFGKRWKGESENADRGPCSRWSLLFSRTGPKMNLILSSSTISSWLTPPSSPAVTGLEWGTPQAVGRSTTGSPGQTRIHTRVLVHGQSGGRIISNL